MFGANALLFGADALCAEYLSTELTAVGVVFAYIVPVQTMDTPLVNGRRTASRARSARATYEDIKNVVAVAVFSALAAKLSSACLRSNPVYYAYIAASASSPWRHRRSRCVYLSRNKRRLQDNPEFGMIDIAADAILGIVALNPIPIFGLDTASWVHSVDLYVEFGGLSVLLGVTPCGDPDPIQGELPRRQGCVQGKTERQHTVAWKMVPGQRCRHYP